MKSVIPVIIFVGSVGFSMISCNKDTVDTKVAVQTLDSIAMPFMGEHYTFYSLRDGKEIPLSDSATTKWDIGIRFTNIILNSHASGPGQGGVIVKTGSYDDYLEAPQTGYAYDTIPTVPGDAPLYAIDGNPRSANAWYIYQPTDHKIISKAGWFFVVKTADGKYAKLEISEATYAGWDGNPTHLPDTLIYKFRYVYQPNGSTDLSAH